MTAKDKAIELVEKYQNVDQPEEYDCIAETTVIECAKIAVDEITNIYNNETRQGRMIAISQDDYKYWQEVKQELEKM